MANAPRIENGLTERQNAFISHYVMNGGKGHQAALEAGYSEKSIRARVSELLNKKDIQRLIREKSEGLTSSLVPMALNEVKNLMLNAKSESVRLQAATTILDRSGIRAKQEIQVNHTLTTKAQYDAILIEIKNELEKREKLVAIDDNPTHLDVSD